MKLNSLVLASLAIIVHVTSGELSLRGILEPRAKRETVRYAQGPVAVHEASSAFQGAQPAQYVRPARHDIQKRSSKRGEDSDEVESTRSMYNKFLRFRAKKKKQGYTADEIKAKFIQEKNLTSKQIADMEPFFIASGRRGRRGAESYIVRIGASRRSFDSERRPSKYDQSLRIFQGQ